MSRPSTMRRRFEAGLLSSFGASSFGPTSNKKRGGRNSGGENDVQATVLRLVVAAKKHPVMQRLSPCFTKIRSLHRAVRPWCVRTVDSVAFQSAMFVFTVYALIGDDIRLSSTEAPADLVFNIITIMAFLLFLFEMTACCVGKADYKFSFFFFLDFVSTVSLILDITWVYAALIQGTDSSEDGGKSETSVARAGRMSKVGARAGRVIRVIRLIRLLRIIKLYKHVFDVAHRLRGDRKEASQGPGEAADEELYAESRVGQKLSHMTTQKVILLILFMLIMLPIISVEEFFRDLPTSSQYGADVVYRAYIQCTENHVLFDQASAQNASLACQTFEQHLTMYIAFHHRQHITGCDTGWHQAFSQRCKLDLGWIGFQTGVVFDGYQRKPVEDHWDHLFAGGDRGVMGSLSDDLRSKLTLGTTRPCVDFADYEFFSLLRDPDLDCPTELRLEERVPVVPRLVSLDADPKMVFIFDLRPWMLRFAVYNILQTVFICAILAVGAMVFSHDANVLVLQPIERMINKVEKIRANPLYAMKLGDDSYREKQEEDVRPAASRGWLARWRAGCCCRRQTDDKVHTLETKILENAIIKLGKLLALGFGEAGSEIIGKNMDDDSATVNAMIPGNKVEAVFGFCSIRNFMDTTEVLQDKVMVFVNQVAEIVHNIVDTWHGAANRNIGDAFLIVWRMREDFGPEERTKIGDMSVVSFIQVVAAINKSAVLKDYREHPAMLARLPNYRVRLGFGLHYGWAIEGAIGSEFKIDASYLSPHVNMASRLEAITRMYQVTILMSAPLAELCSLEMLRHFRTIDHVTLKGGMSAPIRLHTVDLNAEPFGGQHVQPKPTANQFEQRRQREKAKEEKFAASFKVHALFERDPDLKKMRRDFPQRFFHHFNKGYLNYEAGEWAVARGIFEQTSVMLAERDGPSKALLDYMAQFDFDASKVSAKGWPGFRELTET